MTRYLVVHGEDRYIICSATQAKYAKIVAAALSRCDSDESVFEVFSENTDYLHDPAILIAKYRLGALVKES